MVEGSGQNLDIPTGNAGKPEAGGEKQAGQERPPTTSANTEPSLGAPSLDTAETQETAERPTETTPATQNPPPEEAAAPQPSQAATPTEPPATAAKPHVIRELVNTDAPPQTPSRDSTQQALAQYASTHPFLTAAKAHQVVTARQSLMNP